MAQELYKLPKGWEWKKVADVSMDIQYGHTAKATEAGNARFLRITDIQDGQINWDVVPLVSVSKSEFSKYKLNQHDLVFARSGATAGKSILICDPPDNSIFASYLIRIIPRTNLIDPVFISQYFLSPAYWRIVVDNASGAAQPNINGSKLAEFDIPLPPLTEQKRIVAKLGALLSRIAQATQELQESLALADQLFASALDEAFNPLGSMKNAEGLYELPKGWEWKCLGDLSFLKSGGTPARGNSKYWGGNIPWYSSGELNEIFTTEPDECITELAVANSNATLFSKGSLLIGMYDTAALKMSILDRDATFNQAIVGVKPNTDIDLKYILYSIQTFKTLILEQRQGVRQQNLNLSKIKAIQIPLPPLPEQKRIVQRLEALQAKQKQLKETLHSKIQGLNVLKASLLDAAFRGEL